MLRLCFRLLRAPRTIHCRHPLCHHDERESPSTPMERNEGAPRPASVRAVTTVTPIMLPLLIRSPSFLRMSAEREVWPKLTWIFPSRATADRMVWFPTKLRTPGCDTQHRRQRHCRGGLTKINKLHRSPYSKLTNERRSTCRVAISFAVVGRAGVSVMHRSSSELAYSH